MSIIWTMPFRWIYPFIITRVLTTRIVCRRENGETPHGVTDYNKMMLNVYRWVVGPMLLPIPAAPSSNSAPEVLLAQAYSDPVQYTLVPPHCPIVVSWAMRIIPVISHGFASHVIVCPRATIPIIVRVVVGEKSTRRSLTRKSGARSNPCKQVYTACISNRICT